MSRICRDTPPTKFPAAAVDVSPEAVAVTNQLVAQYLTEAAQGDACALFDLGVAFSTDGRGVPGDLIEAHKWFNLASMAGHECAKICRADVAEEMNPRQIAEAQRRAREWITGEGRRVTRE